jgi:hypothetical protein
VCVACAVVGAAIVHPVVFRTHRLSSDAEVSAQAVVRLCIVPP